MKHTALMLLLAAGAAALYAQTQAKPAAQAAKTGTAHAAAKAWDPTKAHSTIPPVHGIVKTAFSLRYEDIKIGTGPVAEPNKLYKVHYMGWLAATGVKFDSSFDHRVPTMKDGKPVLGADGKPELGNPQPLVFAQGFGQLIPGFDEGFNGMRVGGKRRLFIPWQLGYGARDIPAHGPDHPGIPPKTDLVFDVELVEVLNIPVAPMYRGTDGAASEHPAASGGAQHPAAAPQEHPAAAPATPAEPAKPATPAAAEKPATPAQPAAK